MTIYKIGFLKVIVLTLLVLCGCVAVLSQNNSGNVTVTANPEGSICVGESVSLHADANTSSQNIFVDFETGNFSQANFVNSSTYPWAINNTKAYQGTYCMMSGGYHVNNVSSVIQITVNAPTNGVMGFWVRTSSERDYDKLNFYIDNELKASKSGNYAYAYMEFDVTQGTHTYKWEYKKDSNTHSYDDRVYVDNITLFRDNIPNSNILSYGFENGTMQGWTTIDADGDGYNWMLGTEMMEPTGFTGHNESSEIVVSQSYEQTVTGGTVLYPDNYLVSPSKISVTQGASISFWACAQDMDWPSEHFGVAVSTASNNNASDFTTIQEWTMTAKEAGSPTSDSRDGSRVMGGWYQYTVNLSAYAGQYIWVAIRHFNVSDMFYLDVDDITINSGNSNTGNDVVYRWDNGVTGQNITVTPTEPTTYTVTVYKKGFSFGSASKTIVAYPQVSVNITTSTGGTEICEGEEVTLHANAVVTPIAFYSPGDILCTDGSVVKPANWPCGKTAKGIVFYVDESGQHGWAVDKDITLCKVPNAYGENIVKWSSNNYASNVQGDVPGLQNYSQWKDAIKDFDGYANTQIIREYTFVTTNNVETFPAAWSVDFENGWYIPAAGQLNVLFGEILVVNSSLALPGVGGVQITTGDIWSSTEFVSPNYTYSRALKIQMNGNSSTGRIIHEDKKQKKTLRAVINF